MTWEQACEVMDKPLSERLVKTDEGIIFAPEYLKTSGVRSDGGSVVWIFENYDGSCPIHLCQTYSPRTLADAIRDIVFSDPRAIGYYLSERDASRLNILLGKHSQVLDGVKDEPR